MKNLPIASVIEKNKLYSDQAWLIALDIGIRDPLTNSVIDHLRVVRNDEDVVIDGETFVAMPFDISIKEEAGSPEVQLTIQDQTQIVQSQMQLYQGGVGSEVKMIVVHTDSAEGNSSDAELVEFFEVMSASTSDYVVNWTLGAENLLTVGYPARTQWKDQCSYRFKDGNCKYAGAASTCSLRLGGTNGCKAKGNEKNFGGFPGIIARG